MVFIGGPRQVEKTTLARPLLETDCPQGHYFIGDYDEDKRAILTKKRPNNANHFFIKFKSDEVVKCFNVSCRTRADIHNQLKPLHSGSAPRT